MPLVGTRQSATSVRHARACPSDSRYETGASAVEFAILLPIFVMLVFGAIYGGLAIDHKIGITQAAREAARFGSTLPIPPQPGQTEADWLSQVMAAAQAAASADVVPGSANSSACVAFVDPNGTATAKETMDSTGATTQTTGSSCFSDTALGSSQRVQVEIGRDVIFNIGIAQWTLHLSSTSVVQYERPGP